MVKYALINALLYGSATFAFPHLAEEVVRSGLLKDEDAFASSKKSRGIGIPPEVVPFPEYPGRPKHASFNKFDAKVQKVSQEGEHRFIPPNFEKGDIRGPCAGLNLAANHGYIPRNGIATAETIINGLWEAFSLDVTATTFLETATRFFDGDPISGKWSIGYYSPDTQSLGALGNALGNETGICAYGHSKTEADASITRGDWLAPDHNSNCASYPVYVNQLFDLAKDMGTPNNINAQVMARHQYNRKMHSIRTNPNYFSPAYGGVAFTFGAHMFAIVLLGNHSAEHPQGFMRPDGFLDMWSYTKDAKTGELKYKYGHERFPPVWYKRHPEDAWDLEDILISTAQQCASYPANCQIGGNIGKVNSFQGVDPGDVTGGLLNSWGDLTDPAKVGCFISQAIQADVPAFLDKAFNPAALSAITKLIPTDLLPALAPLGSCGGLPKGRSQFQYGSAYPGAKFQASGDRKPYKGFRA